MLVIFDHAEPLTEHISTFYFRPERPVDYIAGQFIELTVPHASPDERDIKHWFTLSSSPTDKLVSITTKFPLAPRHESTFKRALRSLQPGIKLHLSDPMGDFVLPLDISIPLVFIAGGIGITPFHSMVQGMQNTHEQRNIQLLYSVNDASEIIFQELFKNAAIPTTVLTERLSTGSVLEHIGRAKGKRLYISGPEAMVNSLTHNLQAVGIPRGDIITDAFLGYK